MAVSDAAAVKPVPSEARSPELADRPHPLIAGIGQILCIVVPIAVWFAPLSLAPQT